MVNLIDCGRNEFINQAAEKKLYCFGAGKYLQHFINSNYGVSVEAIIDNYRWHDKTPVYINNKAVSVISVDTFSKICDKDCAVIITCLSMEEVLQQLDSLPACDGIDCYIELFLGYCVEHTEINIENKPTSEVIPRKIHYCWFGGNEIPEEYQRYIASWRKYCPDYEIIRWDESNYDVHKNEYIHEAYEQKKWAFVSDYARVDILYHNGGIYFDTDVEVIAPFDEFLVWDLFCGFEHCDYIAWGLGVGAVKGHPILKSVLDVYENMSFIQEDGSLNLKSCPMIQSEVMERYGFVRNGQFQVRNGVAVFPQEFFAPVQSIECFGKITEYSHSIHHYAASWVEGQEQEKQKKYGERFRKIKEHNKNKAIEECYLGQNLTSKIKRFQIWECLPDTNTAGSKAPADIKTIFGRNGYQIIKIHQHKGNKEDWSYQRNVQDWERCYELIPENSILLLQHPFWQEQEKRNEILHRLKEEKHVRIISFVHDVEKLRGIFLSDYIRAEYDFMLQIADVLIVHNERMKTAFLKDGVEDKKIVTLNIFDYLSNVEKHKKITSEIHEMSISIAGNLDVVKSPYIGKLYELSPLKVHLYGPNHTIEKAEDDSSKHPDIAGNIIYHGVFSADMVQEQLTEGFGLVWDGDGLDTCAGGTGEYLRYNNPHKLSLYLAAGLPVIIWKEAAEAEFVKKNGIGIVVASLHEAKEMLEKMTEEKYKQYLDAVEKTADNIRKGKNTEAAIEKTELMLEILNEKD